MLVKLRAPPGPARTELLQMAEVFRARVIDVSERSFTLCVTGDAGKVLRLPRLGAGVGVPSGGSALLCALRQQPRRRDTFGFLACMQR